MTVWTKEKLDSLRNAVPCHWDESSGRYLRIADTGVCAHGANKINKLQEEMEELEKEIDVANHLAEEFAQELQYETAVLKIENDKLKERIKNLEMNLDLAMGERQLLLEESREDFKDKKIRELNDKNSRLQTKYNSLEQTNKNLVNAIHDINEECSNMMIPLGAVSVLSNLLYKLTDAVDHFEHVPETMEDAIARLGDDK